MTEQVQCAVCKKTAPKQSTIAVYHQGRTFYTCGPTCRQQFAGNPGQYAQTATATAAKGPGVAPKPTTTTSAPPPSSKTPPPPRKK